MSSQSSSSPIERNSRSRIRETPSPAQRDAIRHDDHSPDDPLIVSVLTCVIYTAPIIVVLILWYYFQPTENSSVK